MPNRDQLVRRVKDALANLYDPIHLQVHPLASLLDMNTVGDESAGEALRRTLWDAINALRPDSSVDSQRPEWLSYQLLWLYYVQARDRQTVCSELGLGERTFYRRLQEAIEAVATILWERQRPRSASPEMPLASDEARSPTERARDAARTLTSQATQQPIDIRAALNSALDTLRLLADQEGIAIRTEVAAGLPRIMGGPAVLHQIILNVMIEGLRMTASDVLCLSVERKGHKIVWRLSGLDAERTTEHDVHQLGGIEIGRALLQQAYGEDIEIGRQFGSDAWLAFALPIESPIRVLIVDDDENTASLYRRYLAAHSYAVRDAQSAADAQQSIEQEPPDVILLDVLMPQQDGWKLLQRLKTRVETRDIPVIICSVLSQPELALSLGAFKVLQKPISEGALVATLAAALDRDSAAGSHRAPLADSESHG